MPVRCSRLWLQTLCVPLCICIWVRPGDARAPTTLTELENSALVRRQVTIHAGGRIQSSHGDSKQVAETEPAETAGAGTHHRRLVRKHTDAASLPVGSSYDRMHGASRHGSEAASSTSTNKSAFEHFAVLISYLKIDKVSKAAALLGQQRYFASAHLGLGIFIFMFAFYVGNTFLSISGHQLFSEGKSTSKQASQQGLLNWLFQDSLTPLMNRRNHGQATLTVQELGQYIDENDRPATATAELEHIFFHIMGHQDANRLYGSLFRFNAYRSVQLGLATFVDKILNLVLPVWLLAAGIETCSWNKNSDSRDGNEVSPVFAILFLFLGMPFLGLVSGAFCTLLALKMEFRLSGALRGALFHKAQRLPNASQGLTNDLQDGSEQDYSLIQLMDCDVAAITGVCEHCVGFASLIFTCIILIVMISVKIGMAMFAGMAALVVLAMLIRLILNGARTCLEIAQCHTGERLQLLQEFLLGIRYVKFMSWEDKAIDRIAQIRRKEMNEISQLFSWGQYHHVLNFSQERLLLVAIITTFATIYDVRAAQGILILQLLQQLSYAISEVSEISFALMMQGTSVQRFERFLTLPEAPLPTRESLCQANWISIWPSTPDADAEVRVLGSFRNCASQPGSEKPLLHDLDIKIARGSLVAVVGEVGSGKSLLLQAILGELWPVGDAHISIPDRIGYHAQVPFISEASLRDNIMGFSSQKDDCRYRDSIFSSCLNEDPLFSRPGSDRIKIGSRGMTLSGGQKARVSLARVAYTLDAPLVLLDDPFASVDRRTAQHLRRHFLNGPLLSGRTRVVVCQPDPELIAEFDRVIVMSDGCVVADGKPVEVKAAEAFVNLRGSQDNDGEPTLDAEGPVDAYTQSISSALESSSVAREESTDEEIEFRADISSLRFILTGGNTLVLAGFVAVFVLSLGTCIYADSFLARWSDRTLDLPSSQTASSHFLTGYCCLAIIVCILYMLSFCMGSLWSKGFSVKLHDAIMQRLFRAPLDKFFDVTPLGRIMCRCASDLPHVDYELFGHVIEALSLIHILAFIAFLQCMAPMSVMLMALPIYVLVCLVYSRYLQAACPLQSLSQIQAAKLYDSIVNIQSSACSLRAFRLAGAFTHKFMFDLEQNLTVGFAMRSSRVWAWTRASGLWCFLGAALALSCVMQVDEKSRGISIQCLMYILWLHPRGLEALDMLGNIQSLLIHLNRLRAYRLLPQEAPGIVALDMRYANITLELLRVELTPMELVKEGDGSVLLVSKADRTAGTPVLQRSADSSSLVPSNFDLGKTLAVLAPRNKQLKELFPWHRLTAVDGVRDIDQMEAILCAGSTAMLRLSIHSGWLAQGAHVSVDSLRAGYGNIPRNVLHDVSITVNRKCKLAIVGTTGCGKSTFMMCLLRILEPRHGSITIEGVDISAIGLQTLRRALALVPQDSVLFSGSIRENLDPFGEFSDQELWESLRQCQISEHVSKMNGGLDAHVKADGGILSCGQRQLLCMARALARRPGLLLLDEATSAVDPTTQTWVYRAAKECLPNASVIAIAHRLDTILEYDMVVVLEHGQVVEQGEIFKLAGLPGSRFAAMLAANR